MTPGITDFLDPLRHKLIHADVGGGLEIGANNPATIGFLQKDDLSLNVPVTSSIVALGMSVTVTVPAGRRLRISGHCYASNDTIPSRSALYIFVDGVQFTGEYRPNAVVNINYSLRVNAVETLSAGTHTIDLRGAANAGTTNFKSDSGNSAFLLIEDITGVAIPAPPSSVPVGLLAQTSGGNLAAATASTTDVDLGVSLNIVVPAGRTLEVYGLIRVTGAAVGDIIRFRIKMDGTTIGDSSYYQDTSWGTTVPSVTALVSPAAGSHTFTLTFHRETGTGTTTNQGVSIFFVKDITPTPASTDQQPSSTLGYAETITNQTGITVDSDLTGLSTTINVPAGRRIRIYGRHRINHSVANAVVRLEIWEGSTVLSFAEATIPVAGNGDTFQTQVVLSPSAGSHTYKLHLNLLTAGTAGAFATVNDPAFILVEDITGVSTSAHYHGHEVAPSSTLGYAPTLSNQLGISAETDLTNLTVTVTVPADRRIKITGFIPFFTRTAGTVTYVNLYINKNGTNVQRAISTMPNNYDEALVQLIETPVAGTHTYKLRASSDGTVAVDVGNSIGPAYILVEDITGVSTALPVPTGFWAPSNEFPSAPSHGDTFYQRSTDTLWNWNGTAWAAANSLDQINILTGAGNSTTAKIITKAGSNVAGTDASGNITITFPTPFPNAVGIVLVQQGDNTHGGATYVPYLGGLSLASQIVRVYKPDGTVWASSGNMRLSWLAIGW